MLDPWNSLSRSSAISGFRPSAPPNYIVFIAFISGLIISQILHYFFYLSLLFLIGFLVYFGLRTSRGTALLLLILLITGLLYGLERSEGNLINVINGRTLLIKYQVKERSLLRGYIYKGTIRHVEDRDKRLRKLEGKEASLISRLELKEDKIYIIKARVSIIHNKNPGAFRDNRINLYLSEIRGIEEAGSLKNRMIFWGDGADFFLRWIDNKRDGLSQYLQQQFINGPFLSSIVTGERSGLSKEIRDSFNRAGIAHILSISGTHFGLLATLIFFVIRSSISILPAYILRRLTIYITPSGLAALLSLPILVFYLLLSGGSIPAVRSFIMIGLFLLGLLLSKKGYWLNSLLFAAFLILLWDPSSIRDISFQLSFLAVLFLGYSLNEEVGRTDKGILKPYFYLKRTFRMSLFIWLGTTPLVAYYFHYISLISPFVNLIITPAIGLVLLPLTILSSLVYIFTDYFPFESIIAFLTDSSLKIIKYLSSLSFSSLSIGDFPIAILIILYGISIPFIISSLSLQFDQSRRRGTWKILFFFGITSLLIIILPGFNRGFSVTFLDVGHGDCAVIEAHGKTFVIDTGKTGRELEAYLRYKGKEKIDALILTHADKDHSGGFFRILNRFKVKEVWDNGMLLYPEDIDVTVRSLERGDIIEVDGLEMLVMHPYKGFYTYSDSGVNDYSLVIRVKTKKGYSILFTGDIETEAEEDLLYLGRWLKSDVIKISHHGSRHSSSEGFIDAVSTEIAVVSVGRENPFGHPHEEVLDRLEKHAIKVYRTDLVGAIGFKEGERGFTVKTYDDLTFKRGRGLELELSNIKRLFEIW